LQAAGIFSAEELAAIERALAVVEERYAGSPCPQSEAEDLHTWMEAALTELAGEAGRKIHTARSRNDQVATLLKMYLIDCGRHLGAVLSGLMKLLCERAREWSELVFPLQTHTQFAAPGNVGFWALRYATAFDRVRHHLAFCVSQWQQYCPLGSGAVAGSSIPIDRRIQATEMGFSAPSLNALDSTSTRDECLEFLALATQIGLHLQSLAADVIAFSQSPLRWTVYPRDFATGSSMMPNKSNPDALELLRGEANVLAAAYQQAVLILKGLPSGYSRDLQCIKPVVHSTADKLAELCSLATAFLERLNFDAERLRASLALGNIGATRRMERLVLEGTPLRQAHFAVASDDAAAPDPRANDLDCAAYQTIGSASPAETRRIAGELLASLESETPTISASASTD